MKKVSLRVRNFEKERFLTYNIDNEASLDEELLDFVEDEEPEGIVPVIFEEGEEFDTFSYDITDKIRLSELSTQEINAEMVLHVLRSLVLTLINMSEYRVPLSYLVLHRDYIYVDSDYKIEFICIPLEEMQEEVDINSFLRGYLSNIRFDLSEDCFYVAKLLTYVNNTAVFNMRNMLTLVEELMEGMGIEIPEEDSAEIYVDYQEVPDDEEELEAGEEETAAVEEETAAVEEETVAVEEEPVAVEEETVAVEEEPVTIAEEPVAAGEEPAAAEEEMKVDVEDNSEQEEGIEEVIDNEPVEEQIEEEYYEDVPDEDEWEEESEDFDEEAESFEAAVEEEIEEDNLTEEADIDEEEEPQKKALKKPIFKTKDTNVTGVVIEDDLDEFLAEKEREDQMSQHEESGLKIKKNIKINRASIVKSTQDELKAEETEEAEVEAEEDVEEDDVVSTSILSQSLGGTGILKGAPNLPKVNPYLIRTNTKERIMITKQNFKIGKASMGVDYSVKGNGAVSRSHAVITNKNGVYYIKDNKSTNHTYVNNKMVADGESELLTHDCKIVLGDEEFTFKLR